MLVLTQRTRVEDRVQGLPPTASTFSIGQDLVAKIRAVARLRSSIQTMFSPESLLRRPTRAWGISTGGPKALKEILPLFPRDLSVPILVVQHMPPAWFAQRLSSLAIVLLGLESSFRSDRSRFAVPVCRSVAIAAG